MKLKTEIWTNISLIIIGLLLWFYADYSYFSYLGPSNCSGSSLGQPCNSIGNGWYFFAGLGIALVVVAMVIWFYESHRGRLVIASFGAVALGIIIWLSGDYNWFTSVISTSMWRYFTYAGVALIAAGIGVWAYADKRQKLL